MIFGDDDDAVELDVIDEGFLLLIDKPLPVSVDIRDADVATRSRGVEVFTSLLLLLSFKLRRRTGFLRIRLE